jgi:hypothetical protein
MLMNGLLASPAGIHVFAAGAAQLRQNDSAEPTEICESLGIHAMKLLDS